MTHVHCDPSLDTGRTEFLTQEVSEAFRASWHWGSEHLDEMVEHASAERGFSNELARAYFTRHIVYPLSPKHLEGLALFRKLVLALEPTAAPTPSAVPSGAV